ncbi:MAG: DUF3991 and TOPRIM domain-containing protein [Gallionellaceae bacterium]|jgi:hypothetical protein
MASRNYELDDFKLKINLSEFAASHGYVLDRKNSSANSAAMRNGSGDKIIIARDEMSRHWIYFSVHDNADSGTIIDFLNHRTRWSLGDIRKELRPWIGTAAHQIVRPQADLFQKDVKPIKRDRAAVVAAFAAATPLAGGHKYLEDERGIPADVLDSARFAGRIYTDRYNNAIFPHHDRHGVCGFEIRNYQFKGFAKGGEKGLWYSNAFPDDTALVITESAIDGLSYHTLHRPERTRYFSIGGEMNPIQPELLTSAMKKLPHGGTVIIATDHDTAGKHLAERIKDIVAGAERDDLGIIEHRPDKDEQDWNAVLKDALALDPSPAATRHDPPATPRLKP